MTVTRSFNRWMDPVLILHPVFPECAKIHLGALDSILCAVIHPFHPYLYTWCCSPCLAPTNRCWTFSRWWIYSVRDRSGSWDVPPECPEARLVLEYDLRKEEIYLKNNFFCTIPLKRFVEEPKPVVQPEGWFTGRNKSRHCVSVDGTVISVWWWVKL